MYKNVNNHVIDMQVYRMAVYIRIDGFDGDTAHQRFAQNFVNNK